MDQNSTICTILIPKYSKMDLKNTQNNKLHILIPKNVSVLF